jgi:hypothetical protein
MDATWQHKIEDEPYETRYEIMQVGDAFRAKMGRYIGKRLTFNLPQIYASILALVYIIISAEVLYKVLGALVPM